MIHTTQYRTLRSQYSHIQDPNLTPTWSILQMHHFTHSLTTEHDTCTYQLLPATKGSGTGLIPGSKGSIFGPYWVGTFHLHTTTTASYTDNATYHTHSCIVHRPDRNRWFTKGRWWPLWWFIHFPSDATCTLSHTMPTWTQWCQDCATKYARYPTLCHQEVSS